MQKKGEQSIYLRMINCSLKLMIEETLKRVQNNQNE